MPWSFDVFSLATDLSHAAIVDSGMLEHAAATDVTVIAKFYNNTGDSAALEAVVARRATPTSKFPSHADADRSRSNRDD